MPNPYWDSSATKTIELNKHDWGFMTHLGYCGTKNSFFDITWLFMPQKIGSCLAKQELFDVFASIYIYKSSVDSVDQMVYENVTHFSIEQSLCPI